jgi:serpin B
MTSTAYFKASFVHPFPLKNTFTTVFYPVTHDVNLCLMMDQTNSFPYVENEQFQAVALPFNGPTTGGGQLALLILLPTSFEDPDELLQFMPQAYLETLATLETQRVHVQLPKLLIPKRYSLTAPLQQLGMQTPFTHEADFSGINGKTNLYLNQIVHQTYFLLEEKGVTAAVATGASMNVTAIYEKASPIQFIANHPFLFFIVDLKSTEVLFIGKCLHTSTIGL